MIFSLDYLLILALHVGVVGYVIYRVSRTEKVSSNNDDDGGVDIRPSGPILDLPPGIDLPREEAPLHELRR
ncbi:hypothetical protein [Eisenibacter elegans]|jgi:hypothetical protein|uniref:hypothetical protein n=1 Tax=Eisenibacter elegans TaxID=997 RepID=UPI0003FCE42E|nr:hypothetical protein [Eisenibacter elegans]